MERTVGGDYSFKRRVRDLPSYVFSGHTLCFKGRLDFLAGVASVKSIHDIVERGKIIVTLIAVNAVIDSYYSSSFLSTANIFTGFLQATPFARKHSTLLRQTEFLPSRPDGRRIHRSTGAVPPFPPSYPCIMAACFADKARKFQLFRKLDVGKHAIQSGHIGIMHGVRRDAISHDLQVPGSAGVIKQRYRNAVILRGAHRGINAHMGHHSANYQFTHSCRL